MIRRMHPVDYIEAGNWFEDQTGPINTNVLSRESFMYFDGDTPIACVSVFTFAPTVFINWLIANPKSSPKLKIKAFDDLISYVENLSKSRGCVFSYGIATKEVIEKIYTRNNYLVTAVGCTELFKLLGD